MGTWQVRLSFNVGCYGGRLGDGRLDCGLVLDVAEAGGDMAG